MTSGKLSTLPHKQGTSWKGLEQTVQQIWVCNHALLPIGFFGVTSVRGFESPSTSQHPSGTAYCSASSAPRHSVKCPWSCSSSAAPQFSWLLLFTGLGASLEWQASTLAVAGVMWYAVQLHRAHRLAETCGAALPGELFHLTQPFKGHVCVADNLCEQKTKRPPLPSFQFLWLFFFFLPVD